MPYARSAGVTRSLAPPPPSNPDESDVKLSELIIEGATRLNNKSSPSTSLAGIVPPSDSMNSLIFAARGSLSVDGSSWKVGGDVGTRKDPWSMVVVLVVVVAEASDENDYLHGVKEFQRRLQISSCRP